METPEHLSTERKFSAFKAYLLTIGLVTWAFAQPIVPFASLAGLLLSGLALAAGVAIMFMAFLGATIDQRVLKLGAGVTLIGVVGLMLTAISAINRSDAADARCLAIQNDMFADRPVRSDDALIFQALGCRQQ